MAKSKSRNNPLEEDEYIVTEFDPEADGRDIEAGSDSDGDESEDANAATEHYQSVGKSKLRQRENVSLGPKYRGSKVSREALEQDSDDGQESSDDDDDGEDFADPDLVDLEADQAAANDSEIESDNAFAESDAERFKGFSLAGSSKAAKARDKRAKAADYMSSSDEDMQEGEEAEFDDDKDDLEDSGEDDDMDDGLDALVDGGDSDDDDDEEGEEDDSEDGESSESGDEKKQKNIKNSAPSMSTMASSANADVEKGLAIQQQRKVYDGLLNIRIRLQKALVAANTFPVVLSDSADNSGPEPYTAAEEAAVKLLNTISDLKVDFGPSSRAGSKRKRDFDSNMSSDEIWQQLRAEDQKLAKVRRANLEKWSQKVRAVNDASGKKSLTSGLDEQLESTEYRLLKRSRVPRSCAPAQAAKRVAEDERIYDDADFYQQLLKELVDQRTVDTSAADQMSAVPSVMLTAAKDAKSRKSVDRKASKGRKMRFTVHEKLQNFMAPEDRRTWEQGAIDRLFGTLLGQRMELTEEQSEDEDIEGLSADAQGLRLFK